MDIIGEIEAISAEPAGDAAFERLKRALYCFDCSALARTRQEAEFHGEGDVLAHTKLVCLALMEMPEYRALDARRRAILLAAALLHDIGKAQTTRMEDGQWVSPNHSSVGDHLVREGFWRELELCGSAEAITFRETVCALVRFHMLPMHIADLPDPALRVREVAARGELLPDFSWELLLMLSRADALGRKTAHADGMLEQIDLARLLAEECGCLSAPFRFADAHTRRAYFSGRRVPSDVNLYDDSWGEVILLSGLPGSGKDHWVSRNAPGWPVVSLDALRRELGISPEKAQGRVIAAAQEKARVYLRRHESFIWNATNITRETRARQVRLFESYGARVRIVYVEAPWNERVKRNASRPHPVPERAIGEMLRKTTPPMPEEAQTVEWICG